MMSFGAQLALKDQNNMVSLPIILEKRKVAQSNAS